jgi:hypothetical protein
MVRIFLMLLALNVIVGTHEIEKANADPMVVSPILPNPVMTPGVADPNGTRENICLSGYSGSVRNVSGRTKTQVFQEYMLDRTKEKYEVDHLISLELGGSNDIKNLWPQSFETKPWNAHVKDKLENRLHREICDGILTVEEAQEAIKTDWIKSYCEKFDDMEEQCASYLKENKK